MSRCGSSCCSPSSSGCWRSPPGRPSCFDWIVNGDRSGHIQSLILGAVLMLAAVQMFALGIIGDALAGQRAIQQRVYERVRRLELEAGVQPSNYERGDRGRHPAASPWRRSRPASPDDATVGAAETGGNVYDKYGTSNPVAAAADGRVHGPARRAGRADRGATRLTRSAAARASWPSGSLVAGSAMQGTDAFPAGAGGGAPPRGCGGRGDRLRGDPGRGARPRLVTPPS